MEKQIYSRGTLKVNLEVKCGDLTKVALNLQNACNGIYGIEVISLLSGAKKEQYESATKKIAEHLDVLESAIEKRKAAATKQLEDNLVDMDIAYDKKQSLVIEVPTPTAMRLIAVFKQADALCTDYDRMWFSGLLNAEQRTSLVGDVMNSMRNAIGFLINANKKSKAAIEAEKESEEVSTS